MTSLLLGAGAACGASSLYNLGVALQAADAREAPPEHGLRLSLLTRLVRRRRWLAGTALGVIGWPLQTAALLLAPLSVVQPALGFGLALLLWLAARRLKERVRMQDAAAVAAIIGGVTIMALASPAREASHVRAGSLALLLVGVGILGALPYLRSRRPTARLAALGAGAAFAWSGVSTRLVSDGLAGHHWMVALVWAAATGLASGLALLSEMTALQRGRATEVAPTVFAVQVLLPVLAAPALLGEPWHGSALAMTAGLAAVVGGAVALTASPTIGRLVDPRV